MPPVSKKQNTFACVAHLEQPRDIPVFKKHPCLLLVFTLTIHRLYELYHRPHAWSSKYHLKLSKLHLMRSTSANAAYLTTH